MELKRTRPLETTTICELLIVPYGIETGSLSFTPTLGLLLIVPYGIETLLMLVLMVIILAFNRTLWN